MTLWCILYLYKLIISSSYITAGISDQVFSCSWPLTGTSSAWCSCCVITISYPPDPGQRVGYVQLVDLQVTCQTDSPDSLAAGLDHLAAYLDHLVEDPDISPAALIMDISLTDNFDPVNSCHLIIPSDQWGVFHSQLLISSIISVPNTGGYTCTFPGMGECRAG